MKKLKVGITCYPSIGGSGIVATELGKALAKRGHKIHFITYEKPFRLGKNPKNIFYHQVEVNQYDLFRYPDYTLPLAVKLAEISEKYNLDLLHMHYAVPHATAALLANSMSHACHMCAPKIITTLHGTDITLLGRDKNLQPAIKFAIDKSNGVTAVSKALAAETKKVLATKKPIEVIYNFFEPKTPNISGEKIRKSLKVKADEFLLIHMSNLRGVKRIEDLLKILSLVPKEFKIKLLILSGGKFDVHQPLVKKLKIRHRIILKSNVQDIENYINASDSGIYTSQTESFGMGILETMAYGKPVLATRAGGIPEVLVNNQSGLLYPVGDVKGFAKGIQALAANQKLAQELGKNAQQRAVGLFSTAKIVEQYEKYYYDVLNENFKHWH